MKLLNTLGLPNLLLIAAAQLIFRHGFLEYQAVTLALNTWQNALLVLSTVLIGAGGYLMNGLVGENGNKTGLSESVAYNVYAGLTIAGVGIGFYLSNHIEKPWFCAMFIVVAYGLYLYASSLKYSIILSNVIIALLIVLSILVLGIFNLYPTYGADLSGIRMVFSIIIDYCAFIFFLALLLTLVKDLKHTDADYNNGTNTLPIAIGKKRTARVAFFVALIPAAMLLYYANANLKEYGLWYALGFILLFILGPLVWFLINIWDARSQKEFSLMEKVIKATLFFTAVSIAVVTYNIHHNA
jgi:4-hydroxybenzoate polyprenyltransferase